MHSVYIYILYNCVFLKRNYSDFLLLATIINQIALVFTTH